MFWSRWKRTSAAVTSTDSHIPSALRGGPGSHILSSPWWTARQWMKLSGDTAAVPRGQGWDQGEMATGWWPEHLPCRCLAQHTLLSRGCGQESELSLWWGLTKC